MENNRKITKEAAENLALKYGIKLWEVSAKDNTNIEEMFLDTIKTLLEKNSKIISEGSSMVTNIQLNKNVKNKKNKKCC